MKINIQKIAYRAIPVVTALVVLFSSVVVGNPLKANAADISSRYDENSFVVRDAPLIKLHPRSTLELYDDSNRFLGENFFEAGEAISLNTSFTAYLSFADYIYKKDVGNTFEFSGLDYSLSFSNESGGGNVSFPKDYLSLEFYTESGEYISNASLFRDGEKYKGTIEWPADASYFRIFLILYFDCSNAYGYGYFAFDYVFDRNIYPTLASYNVGSYEGMSYSWSVGNDYEIMSFNAIAGSHDGRWYDVNRIYMLGFAHEYQYERTALIDFVTDEFLIITYTCPVIFDLFELRPSQMELSYWAFSVPFDMSVDVSLLAAGFHIVYYDSTFNEIGEQRFACDLCKDLENKFTCPMHTATVDFDIPAEARYLAFRVSSAIQCNGTSTLCYEVTNFVLNVYRVESGFKSICDANGILYLTPEEEEMLGQLGDALAGILPNDHPLLDSSSMDDITDADGLAALTSCISSLWSNTLIVSMLVAVVTLAIVSYVFFGKKG